MLPDLIRRGRQPSVGITVSNATITLRITAAGQTQAAARAAMQPTIDTIHACLGDIVFGYEDDELQEAVVRLLHAQNKRLSVWECGSGGLATHWLREADPAGEVLESAIIASNGSGAELMAEPEGVERWLRKQAADAGVCQLFIGPFPWPGDGGNAPGTFAAGVRIGERLEVKSWPFSGHPDILKPRAAKQALNLLRQCLRAAADVP
jgi:nicotinamide-nucleotide amidase